MSGAYYLHMYHHKQVKTQVVLHLNWLAKTSLIPSPADFEEDMIIEFMILGFEDGKDCGCFSSQIQQYCTYKIKTH